MHSEPVTSVDSRFGQPDAPATAWAQGAELLESAEIYWLTTVRADGRPHVTPLIGIWLDNRFHFATGPEEQKARNLEGNDNCVVTTGMNRLHSGLDVVIEGRALRVTDEHLLHALVDAYAGKYRWSFDVQDGALHGGGGRALVFQVLPDRVFGFNREGQYSQTRWTFS